MKYLLDTNVISELIKQKPSSNTIRWIDDQDENNLFLSVITFGELQKGISKLTDENRAQRPQRWVDQELSKRFEGRVLNIDLDVIYVWGKIQNDLEKIGIKLSVIDSLIAATAIAHNMTVVTQNIKDFEYNKLSIYNPWNYVI